MPTDNETMFAQISDLINTPSYQDTLNEAGGIITSTGLIWPVDNEIIGVTFYYDINILSHEVFLLPYLDSDADDATQITNQNDILSLLIAIHTFTKIVTSLKTLSQNPDPRMAAAFAQNPKNIPFFIASSMS